MHFWRLSCLFNNHKPDRKSVRWAGSRYEGKCQSCGCRITRISTGIWRKSKASRAGAASRNDSKS
jgi:hypothetical protein